MQIMPDKLLKKILSSIEDQVDRQRAIEHANNFKLSHSQKKITNPNRHLIHLCGIPGAGKSYYANKFKDTHYLLAFDEVMTSIPEYQQSITAHGKDKSFRIYELEARYAGYHVLFDWLEEGLPILFDHSASDKNHLEILKIAKEHFSYSTEMHYLKTPLDKATQRVKTRNQQSNRHTPLEYLQERLNVIHDLLDDYISVVDNFVEVEFTE